MSTTYQFQDILIFETSYIHDRFLNKIKTKKKHFVMTTATNIN